MNNLDEPCTPINGRNPEDREYRILDDHTVEQWSRWAGMWDVASHHRTRASAEGYVALKRLRDLFMADLYDDWKKPDSGALEAVWEHSDGYGIVGYIPEQGYDWSGIRDSTDQAVGHMWVALQEHNKENA